MAWMGVEGVFVLKDHPEEVCFCDKKERTDIVIEVLDSLFGLVQDCEMDVFGFG